jgi:hypothetical protein
VSHFEIHCPLSCLGFSSYHIPPSRPTEAQHRSKRGPAALPARQQLKRPKLVQSPAVPVVEGAELTRKRARKRGCRSQRPRGGREKQEQKIGAGQGRARRLRERAFREGEAVCSDEFSIQANGLASSTGWQGRAPPKKTQSELKQLCETGEIKELLQVFFPIPYSVPP